MPKLDSKLLQDFGREVKKALAKQNRGINDVGGLHESIISRIQNGKANPSIRTITKIVNALELDEAWIDRFLDAGDVGDEERGEGLLGLAMADKLGQETPEVMLRTLAFEAAIDAGDDLGQAFQDLRATLQAFKDMKAAANGGNKEPELTALRQRVIVLNNEMDRDGAQEEIQSDILKADKTHFKQQIERYNLAVTQAKLQNNPEFAANMIVERLKFEKRPEGLFAAVISECNALTNTHSGQASRFFDRVKLILAQGNLKRAKGVNKGAAYLNIAINQSDLAFQEKGVARLQESLVTVKKAIQFAEKHQRPDWRASTLAQFSDCLLMMWERQGGDPDPQMIKAAQLAHKLIVETSGSKARHRATVTVSLANILSDLGQAQEDAMLLDDAIAHFNEALVYCSERRPEGVRFADGIKADLALAHLRRGRIARTVADLRLAEVGLRERSEQTKKDKPYLWAIAQWNLADLALAEWEISGDLAKLDLAQERLGIARAKFEEGLSEFQLSKCDELQAQIDAAKADKLNVADLSHRPD